MRIERLSRELGFSLQWTAFPLHPETPKKGRLLSDLFAAHPDYLDAMWSRLLKAAEELGLAFGERSHTFNSRHAFEVAKWAEEQGTGWAFHLAIYEAYFVQGKNIAKTKILQEAAESVGLDGTGVPDILQQAHYATAVDRDWARCASRGVRAIPTLDNGSGQLVGFQSSEAQLNFVNQAS